MGKPREHRVDLLRILRNITEYYGPQCFPLPHTRAHPLILRHTNTWGTCSRIGFGKYSGSISRIYLAFLKMCETVQKYKKPPAENINGFNFDIPQIGLLLLLS